MTRTQRSASTTNTRRASSAGSAAVGASAWDMPGRRGTAIGPVLIILGIWGAIIPLVGPLFGYASDAEAAWVVTWDRWWLSILPGIVVIVGGLLLIASMDRASAALGGVIAAAGGAWFVIGPSVALLWGGGTVGGGTVGAETPGSAVRRFLEQFGMFYGLGAVILALAVGIGTRALVRSRRDEDLLAEPLAAEPFGAEPVGAEQVGIEQASTDWAAAPRTERAGGVERINTLPSNAPIPTSQQAYPAGQPAYPTGQPAYPDGRADPQAEQRTDPLSRNPADHSAPRNR